ncbi:MAG: zinc-binding dehydrogenase [Desulfobacterales bacterium]|nr:zinc-binding dehydrogenase [Desulfobacterales bacterium]
MKALRFSVTTPQFVALKALGAVNARTYYQGPLATVSYDDIPEPELPGPDWVKIQTLFCGFCASDLNLIFLRDSPSASPFTSFPCVLGHELSGRIVETGSSITGVQSGDLVTVAPNLSCAARGISPPCQACRAGRVGNCENFAEGRFSPGMFSGICRDLNGGFAPFMVAHESQVFKLHEGMTPVEGALIEPLAVALQAVYDNRPEDNDHVLVVGGGVIGTMVVQSIRALGCKCRVTVSEPMPHAAEAARKAGADEVVSGDLFDHTVRITGARRYKPMIGKDILMGGFHRVFDCVGNTKTLNAAMRCMAVGGRLSIVGIGHDVKLDLTPLWLKWQQIHGVFSYGQVEINGRPQHVFQAAVDLVRDKRVRLGYMATHTFSLADYIKLIETNMEKGKHKAIKTMVAF